MTLFFNCILKLRFKDDSYIFLSLVFLLIFGQGAHMHTELSAVLLSRLLTLRFRALNRALTTCMVPVYTTERGVSSVGNPLFRRSSSAVAIVQDFKDRLPRGDTVRSLINGYNELMEISKKVCNCLSPQLFALILYKCAHATLNAYFVFTYIFMAKKESSCTQTYHYGTGLLNMFQIGIMCEAAQALYNEVSLQEGHSVISIV